MTYISKLQVEVTKVPTACRVSLCEAGPQFGHLLPEAAYQRLVVVLHGVHLLLNGVNKPGQAVHIQVPTQAVPRYTALQRLKHNIYNFYLTKCSL